MTSYPKIHFRLFQSLRMRITYPRPLRPACDWLTVFVTRSSSFQEHKGQVWKLSLEEKKTRMLKEGQQREATDWWSPVSRQKRGVVSWGRERDKCWKSCLFALIEKIVELTENMAHVVCLLLLVSRFNVSFLCVLIQIMCKHKNMQAHWRTRTHTYTAALLSDFDMCFY